MAGMWIPQQSLSDTEVVERIQSKKAAYGNKADFCFMKRVAAAFQRAGFCDLPPVGTSTRRLASGPGPIAVVIGGINRGQLAHVFADNCRGAFTLGLEIQMGAYATAKASFPAASYPRVVLLREGFSDKATNTTYASDGRNSDGELGGLFDPAAAHLPLTASASLVPVYPLPALHAREVLPRGATLLHTIIDTEGHEPAVIKGMVLGDVAHQRVFNTFHFEVGSTWLDSRHPAGAATFPEVVRELEGHGYLLYLVGMEDLLPINSRVVNRTQVSS